MNSKDDDLEVRLNLASRAKNTMASQSSNTMEDSSEKMNSQKKAKTKKREQPDEFAQFKQGILLPGVGQVPTSKSKKYIKQPANSESPYEEFNEKY